MIRAICAARAHGAWGRASCKRQVSQPDPPLQSYRDVGVFVAGLDAVGNTTIRDMDLATAPLVLVTGSEGCGLSRIVVQACDVLDRIPITASTESLTGGVANSIALYEVAAIRSR